MSIISSINSKFLSEARNSPILLNDLSNLERYISETYSNRSLIELLQNADDAMSTKFLVKQIDSKRYIVANNGRCFTDNDLIAICRSGESTKKRSSGTIGYRGIGFKSVVNYTEAVHIISGDIECSFSKKLSRAILGANYNVPLIRIPHEFNNNNFSSVINELKSLGYSTIFIFEVKNTKIFEEIIEFDKSCLLFLKNITQVEFDVTDRKSLILTKLTRLNANLMVLEFLHNHEYDDWLIYSSNTVSFAFRYNLELNKVLPTNEGENVFHAFMPTSNKVPIPIKINADFSTDPSRTKVEQDEYTLKAIEEVGLELFNLTKEILLTGKDTFGFARILNQYRVDSLSKIRGKGIGEQIINNFRNRLNNYIDEYFSKYDAIYCQPPYLTEDEYMKICQLENLLYINSQDVLNVFKINNIEELPIHIILKDSFVIELSSSTRSNIISYIINNFSLGFDSVIVQLIKEAPLFDYDSGVSSIEKAKDEVLSENFIGLILDKVNNLNNLYQFEKRFGIQISSNNQTTKNIKNSINEIKNIQLHYKNKEIITAWRSAEQQMVAIIENFENISNAVDVSKQNLGYDIVAYDKHGEKFYYEVKKVDYLGQAFSMTNNEFSTAVQEGKNYNLAIVCYEKDNIEVCIINNPIKEIKLEKRVTRWEWLCNEYTGDSMRFDI